MKKHKPIKNLVLVSYDSTRADVAYSGKFPGIESVRSQGVTFKNCVSSSPLTPVSHASVMTGLQPRNHGVRHLFREQLRDSVSTIASRCADQGFATSAVVSCPGLNRWYGLDRGFHRYDDEIPRLANGADPLHTVDVKLRGQALKRAELVIERSQQLLESMPIEKPFFHFIHFFDAHWPYGPPVRQFSSQAANAYEEEIAYLDHHFMEWMNWMKRTGRLTDTLVVLFSDHGEDLNGWYPNDKGGDELGHPEEMGHGCLLYDQTILVPLIFWHPDFVRAEIEEQVRLIDIKPTVMELLGIELCDPIEGLSLASVVRGARAGNSRIAYSETFYPREQVEATKGKFNNTRNKKAIRIANRYKVIMHLDSDIIEAYDLESDPTEQQDLLSDRGTC